MQESVDVSITGEIAAEVYMTFTSEVQLHWVFRSSETDLNLH